MALRDAAHEIAPIHVHSVEWSDPSVPVQKRTFSGPYVHYKRDTIRKSACWSVWFLHSPMTRFFQCGGLCGFLYTRGNGNLMTLPV